MRTVIIAAAAVLSLGGPACAQSDSNLAVAPPARSTGPTIPDTRQIDQSQVLPPASSAASGSSNTAGTGNWRAADGLNADPNNPNGAPGPSSTGTSPTR